MMDGEADKAPRPPSTLRPQLQSLIAPFGVQPTQRACHQWCNRVVILEFLYVDKSYAGNNGRITSTSALKTKNGELHLSSRLRTPPMWNMTPCVLANTYERFETARCELRSSGLLRR